MTNKRELGDKLENLILDLLKEINKNFSKTANSGAKWSDGDIKHPLYVIEIKKKASSGGFSFPKKDYTKLVKISEKTLREWIYISSNNKEELVACIDFNFLLELLELYIANIK